MSNEEKGSAAYTAACAQWNEAAAQASTIVALKEQLAAARGDALEEAAKLCESVLDTSRPITTSAYARFHAHAIRALASQPAAPVQPQMMAVNLSNGSATEWNAAPPVQQPGDVLNGGMHASIFVKVWGDAGGGDEGRIALANYAFDLGVKSTATTRPSAALTDEHAAFEAWMKTTPEWDSDYDEFTLRPDGLYEDMRWRNAFESWQARAILAASSGAVAVPEVDGVRWDLFPGYLIDHCEGETITEEGLQQSVAAMLRDPDYIRVSAAPAIPAQGQTK